MYNMVAYIPDFRQEACIILEQLVTLIGRVDKVSNVVPDLGSIVPRETVAKLRTLKTLHRGNRPWNVPLLGENNWHTPINVCCATGKFAENRLHRIFD